MIPAAFGHVRPDSVEQALVELADPDAKAIAGGHSLLPLMKLRLARPSLLVDLDGLDLRGVSVDGDTIRLGPLTTYDELLSLDVSVPLPAALRDCASAVGDLQVRNAGTVGGGLAHADPASDFAAGAIAVGATLVLQSLAGTREVAAADFFVGPFTTLLRAAGAARRAARARARRAFGVRVLRRSGVRLSACRCGRVRRCGRPHGRRSASALRARRSR